MTLRALPALSGALASHADARLSDKVLARWNGDIRAAAEADTAISVLGVIGEDVWGEGVSARRVAAALRYIGDKPVTVNINSPGGNFMEGVAIYNLLRQHPQAVTVKILGVAASAAAIIAMAGDEIEIAKAGFLMIHNTHVAAYADRNGLRDVADKLELFDNTLATLFADRSGAAKAAIAAQMDAETYFDGPAAIDTGLADALLPEDAVREEPSSKPSALKRVDNALSKGGWSRSEIRAAFKELTGMPRAAENGMPGAADAAVTHHGSLSLGLALARLKRF